MDALMSAVLEAEVVALRRQLAEAELWLGLEGIHRCTRCGKYERPSIEGWCRPCRASRRSDAPAT